MNQNIAAAHLMLLTKLYKKFQGTKLLKEGYNKYFSLGVNDIGIATVKRYFKRLLKLSNLPIVSIGSGSGVVELLLDQAFDVDIICVDPDPHSFSTAPEDMGKKPKYPLVSDLIKDQPTIVGNCILLLVWSPPNASTYDYDALVALCPNLVLWIGEPSGSAGGATMLKWLQKCGIKAEPHNPGKDFFPRYQLLDEDHVDGFDNFIGWPIWNTIALLQRPSGNS